MKVDQFLTRRFRGGWTEKYHLELWHQYSSSGLADPHFEQEITSGDEGKLWQRVWEMVMYRLLVESGYAPTSAKSGPDFCFMIGERKVFVECIAPMPTGLPPEWLAQPDWSGKVQIRRVPSAEILLRWTAAIKEKRDKLEGKVDRKSGSRRRDRGYRGRGIVGDKDCYVIAVDGRMLLNGFDHNTGSSRLPFAVEAVFPIGPLGFPISEDGKIATTGKHSPRFSVRKPKGVEVPTDNFLNVDYAGVSAVIGCTSQSAFNSDLKVAIVHNPEARAPLPARFLGDKGEEYVAARVGPDEYELVLPDR